MKALSLIIQKLWPMVKSFVDRQTNRQGNNYMPKSIDAGGIKEVNLNLHNLMSKYIINNGHHISIMKQLFLCSLILAFTVHSSISHSPSPPQTAINPLPHNATF